MNDARVGFAVALSAFGVSATVTPPEGPAVLTGLVWDAGPPEGEQPYGATLGRLEQRRRVVALPRTDLPTLPRGTVIVAAEAAGEVAKTWKTEEVLQAEWDCWHVFIVPA